MLSGYLLVILCFSTFLQSTRFLHASPKGVGLQRLLFGTLTFNAMTALFLYGRFLGLEPLGALSSGFAIGLLTPGRSQDSLAGIGAPTRPGGGLLQLCSRGLGLKQIGWGQRGGLS